ncbi:MAG: TIGR01906 family membrane protein [Tissierellia bacterium]|nr:TIGR01906 family membrane protein [Tissierellia bacterium]
MKTKNKVKTVAIHIWAFLLAIAIILGMLLMSISLKSQDVQFYNKFQRENSIDEVTGKTHDELDGINLKIAYYLQTGYDYLLEDDFNQKEVMHMQDVWKLFELAYRVMSISVTIIIVSLMTSIFLRVKDELMIKTLRYILVILGLVALMVAIMSFDFNKYFVIFHEIFFDNDLWLLDPRTDLMIQMMPLNFFIQMSIRILIQFLVFMGVVIAVILLNHFLIYKKNKGCVLCNTTEVE